MDINVGWGMGDEIASPLDAPNTKETICLDRTTISGGIFASLQFLSKLLPIPPDNALSR